MYYYIFEPTSDPKEMKIQEEIKTLLSNLNIVGEFVTLSLAEEPRDLARVGLRKNYATIVACGSDKLINEVGSGLIETQAVLGAVPFDEKSIFHSILGTKNYIDACNILPRRKVLNVDTGIINQENLFITQIIIKPKKEIFADDRGLIIVNFDGDFQAETKLTEITVSNVGLNEQDSKKIRRRLSDHRLDVFIPDQLKDEPGFLTRLFRRGTSEERTGDGSTFHPREITVESRKRLVTTIGDKVITNGNVKIQSYPESLNIIIKRESPKTESSPEEKTPYYVAQN